ncbi:MAG: hypothetical protein J5833_07060, partial [Victivallales bacterium]|nr:hypothetical protein [Victivallales bacterium]
MALSEIRKTNGAIKGKGLAISAMAIPVAAVILTIAIIVVSVRNGHHREGDWTIACSQNLKMIGLSLQMYAEDNDDCLPDSLDNSYIRETFVGNEKVFV